MTSAQTLSAADLQEFTGSEHWYRHALTGVLYTDGAKYVAETRGAYWLLDEIALAQKYEKRVMNEGFQVWTLAVRPDNVATLFCGDGNGNTVFQKSIEYTDFPPPGVTLYSSENTIYLPSEY